MKLVIEEAESEALAAYVARERRTLVTSRIALVEVTRAATVASPDPGVRHEAERLVRSCVLVDLRESVLRLAMHHASEPVRTLDAVHLASAELAGATEMLVYDRRLATAAAEQGLAIRAPR